MDLTNYTATAISSMKDKFDVAKWNSSMLVKAQLETVEEITNGEAVLVDASSPAVMLMEMAACLASNCVQENVVLLRKQYPALSRSVSELYLHMSDDDHLNRFATPGRATMTMVLMLSELKSAMVYDATEAVYKAQVARDTTITVDGVCFMPLYPIVFRMTNAGAIQVAYDGNVANPIYALANTIIKASIRRTTDLIDYLFFEFEAIQVSIDSQFHVLEKAYSFKKTFTITDSFHYARVFYRNEDTASLWKEMKTTHTDQVFDANTPTAVLSVDGDAGEVTVSVPPVYLTTGLISGEIRVDLYTTKGVISMDLSNYTQEKFEVDLKAIDEVADKNDYTLAFSDISFYVYSSDIASGGSYAVDFDTLRARVINNGNGPQVVPITNIQMDVKAETYGFDIVRNVDLLTNRVFLATRRLPAPSNKKLITSANIGMVTYANSLEKLVTNEAVINNGDRLTIRSKALWISENGKVALMSKASIDALYAMSQTAMLADVNTKEYFYTPFYYVMDASGDEFEVRAYSLDLPVAKNLNFIRQNQTLQLSVNSGSYGLKKVSGGYELRIVTNSGANYKGVDDGEVGVQLAFYPYGETTLAYITGILESKNSAQERVYLFKLNTNHDFNSNDLISLTNAQVEGITDYKAWISLETEFNLLHYTTSISKTYVADATDGLIGKFLLPKTAVGNSHEKLTLTLGYALTALWRRARSYQESKVYRKHTIDVPATYTEDVYEINPVTGSMLFLNDGEPEYHLLHAKGSVVKNSEGETVYKYRVGDVMLDEQGNPVYDFNSQVGREMDLLVVDGRYYFANDTASISYRDEIEKTMVDWITDSLSDLQGIILEKTKIFFYPKTTLGDVAVYVQNGEEKYLPAEQSFTVALHVNATTYNDADIREKLEAATVSLLDDYIGSSVVNVTEINEKLRTLYGSSVVAFSVSGLGGTENYDIVTLQSDRTKLCLKKKLVAQADKTLIVEDDVTFEFSRAS